MTIRQAAAALRARQISARELTEEALRRTARLNPKLNAFITVTEESARARARELDDELARGVDRGPLHGIPIAHKDIICTRGVRTSCGSRLFADYVPDFDAAVVAKFDSAGAVMIGKTGLHELAYGITSDNPHFGSVRNPWDSDRIPGGSSGGSGVAVAAGLCLAATGTDTGGSIRIPASFCGVVGLKPTYGLVSRFGVRPLGLSLDHIGPLAGNVGDTWTALQAMLGHDSRDGSSVKRSSRPFEGKIEDLRIGLPGNFYFDHIEPGIRAAIRAAATHCEELGMRVEVVRVPDVEALNAVGRVILLAEASAVYEQHLAERDRFGADVLSLLEQGRLVPATSYVNAQRIRKVLAGDFRRLFNRIDLLLTPTTPIPAARIGEREIVIDGHADDVRLASTRLVRGINVLGYPALSMPCGITAGLPAGLQIIGRPFEEPLMIEAAAQLEKALGLSLSPDL